MRTPGEPKHTSNSYGIYGKFRTLWEAREPNPLVSQSIGNGRLQGPHTAVKFKVAAGAFRHSPRFFCAPRVHSSNKRSSIHSYLISTIPWFLWGNSDNPKNSLAATVDSLRFRGAQFDQRSRSGAHRLRQVGWFQQHFWILTRNCQKNAIWSIGNQWKSSSKPKVKTPVSSTGVCTVRSDPQSMCRVFSQHHLQAYGRTNWKF